MKTLTVLICAYFEQFSVKTLKPVFEMNNISYNPRLTKA